MLDIDFTLDCELDDVTFAFDPDLQDEPAHITEGMELLDWFTPDGDPNLKAWIADVYVDERKVDLISVNAANGMAAAEKMHQWASWKYGAEAFISFGIGTYADYERLAA